MRKGKLEAYKLVANIHTTEVTNSPLAKIVNPDKEVDIIKYSEFKAKMDRKAVFASCAGGEYAYERIDFKLDSFGENDYLEYLKLNNLLLNLYCMQGHGGYSVQNKQPSITRGGRTYEIWSIFVFNPEMAINYYNKELEQIGKYETDEYDGIKYKAKARLEFRVLRLDNTKDPAKALKRILLRLRKILKAYPALLEKTNEDLHEAFCRWLKRNKRKDKTGLALTQFVREHSDAIFSREQLRQFLKICGVKNYQQRAKSIADTVSLESISEKEVWKYVDMIIAALNKFMDS